MRWSSLILLSCLFLLAACSIATQATLHPTIAVPVRITLAGSTTMQPLIEKLAAAYHINHPEASVQISAGGSKIGIKAATDGTIDLGMASRALTANESKPYLEQQLVGYDVLALVVHPTNAIQNLTSAQLRAIYNGQITNWSALGGPNRPIIVIAREDSSGTRGAFDELVLKDTTLRPDARLEVTASGVRDAVASNSDAIGYLSFGYLDSTVTTIAINTIKPTPATVENKTYPLIRPLILLLGPRTSPAARAFVQFITSPTGQALVAKDGWVPAAK